MTPNEKYDLEQAQRRELRKANDVMRQRHAEREAADLANAERDAPIRAAFHTLLVKEGFREHITPKPGTAYDGSHTQALWEFFLAATLAERERCALACEFFSSDADNPSVAYGCATRIRSGS